MEWVPFWNDTVKIESGGRHPLLLNRFHSHMEEFLIKAIVSTTERLRYISYCCWIVGDIESSLNCKSYNDFDEAFRRRENALAIGSYLLKPPDSVHGTYKIYGQDSSLRNFVEEEDQDYNCSFKLMQSVRLGAFDLFYRGTIFNWGLIWQDENGVIRLTDEGRDIYEILVQYYNSSTYYTNFKGKKVVPGNVLKEWAEINNFDNILENHCKKEREFYKRIIFRLDGVEQSDLRRDTFAFFLECIKQCSENGVCFTEDVLRNIHYYTAYFNKKNQVIAFNKTVNFDDVDFYWMIYEMHVYFRWWISEYFRYFLSVLKAKDEGVSVDEFINSIDINEFNNVSKKYVIRDIDYFSNTLGNILKHLKGSISIDDSYSEESITFDGNGTILSSGDLAKVVLILLSLYNKYKKIKNDQRYIWIRGGKLSDDFWFDSLFIEFENLKTMKTSEFLIYILKKHIINRHDLRMYEMRDLRRCWLTMENGRYVFQADESPIWRPAKYGTIWSFLIDMQLIEYSGEMLVLTKDGQSIYNKLLSEYYI